MSLLHEFASIDEFVAAMKELKVEKIAFAEVNERRAEQTGDDLLEVVVIREVTLKSYRDSVIYRCFQKCNDLDQVYNRLVADGFDVTRINKNIT